MNSTELVWKELGLGTRKSKYIISANFEVTSIFLLGSVESTCKTMSIRIL